MDMCAGRTVRFPTRPLPGARLNAMRKITLPLILCLLSARSPAEEIPFQDLSRRSTLSIAFRTDTFTVARNETELNAIWPDSVAAARRGDPARFPIEVPFDREMVIAAILATHRTGCTGVRITRVVSENDRLVTHYRRSHYPHGTPCTTAMTTAFHLVTVPVSALPVVFVEDAVDPSAD